MKHLFATTYLSRTKNYRNGDALFLKYLFHSLLWTFPSFSFSFEVSCEVEHKCKMYEDDRESILAVTKSHVIQLSSLSGNDDGMSTLRLWKKITEHCTVQWVPLSALCWVVCTLELNMRKKWIQEWVPQHSVFSSPDHVSKRFLDLSFVKCVLSCSE